MKSEFSLVANQMLRLGRAIHRRLSSYNDHRYAGEVCPACGRAADLVMGGVLWPELVLQWELNAAWANWIDQREGLRCKNCKSNLRSRHLAQNIVSLMNDRLGTKAVALRDLCANPEMRQIEVAEINAAGDLHQFLSDLSNLRYSEFGSVRPDVPSEDLLNLSYEDERFDLVITSDVLEHVPDVERALLEIHRVLKPNGLHIFSVPVIWNKQYSRRRATLRDGELVHILSASHHGSAGAGKSDFLVFNEFGRDFTELCKRSGFSLAINEDSRNPSLVTFVSTRQNSTAKS